MDQLNASRIQAQLATRIFGRNLIVLPRTGSTNDVAKEQAVQCAPEGMVVLADEQTVGRGRMGRRWLAPSGTCLLCSILFRPDLPPTQAQRLTMLCALATADAVKDAAGLQVWLKWPNDLVVKVKPRGWRKLAGMLTETGVGAQTTDSGSQIPNPGLVHWRLEYVIVGIGVNVNVAPPDLVDLAPGATSILAETGQQVDRMALLAALLAGVEMRYARLQAGESPYTEWAARLATLGQPVQATISGGKVTGTAEAVDEDGALMLRVSDGTLHRLMAGDVTLTG